MITILLCFELTRLRIDIYACVRGKNVCLKAMRWNHSHSCPSKCPLPAGIPTRMVRLHCQMHEEMCHFTRISLTIAERGVGFGKNFPRWMTSESMQTLRDFRPAILMPRTGMFSKYSNIFLKSVSTLWRNDDPPWEGRNGGEVKEGYGGIWGEEAGNPDYGGMV